MGAGTLASTGPQVLTVRSVRRADAAEATGRHVRTLDLLLVRGVRDQFCGPDALAATRAMDQAHTQDGHRAPGTTGALQLEGRPAMSTITSPRATAPRASGAALRGLATRISAETARATRTYRVPYCLTPVNMKPTMLLVGCHPMPDMLSLPLLIQASIVRGSPASEIEPVTRHPVVMFREPVTGAESTTPGR